MSNEVMGMTTCSSRTEARRLARAVLDAKHAACVNIVNGLESHYWWRGKVERAKEYLLLIKTTRSQVPRVIKAIRSVHSYEVPEIIFLPVVAGERRYLQWLRQSLKLLVASLLFMASLRPVAADQVDDLIKKLGDADEQVRAEAAESLASIGGERAQTQFRQMLDSPSPERRQTAVVALLQISDETADLERVRARLKDNESTVRWSAALALGQSGRIVAVPWLEEIAKADESESVREAAAEAVTKLRSTISWERSVADALLKAKDLHKPVLAYFSMRGSSVCRQWEEGVLADPTVVNATQEFVCARVDAGDHVDQARQFDVRGSPTVLVLDAQGNEMSRVTGLVEKETFLTRLAETRRGKLTFREALRLAKQNTADVQANWKVAQTYLEEGREELAEPHLRNVLAHDEQNRFGYTDDAMFALGFTLGKRGQHAQAAYCLEHLLARWPNFDHKDKVLYCLGLSQLALGQREKGRQTLETLLRECPDSSTVKNAQSALEKMGTPKGEHHDKNQ